MIDTSIPKAPFPKMGENVSDSMSAAMLEMAVERDVQRFLMVQYPPFSIQMVWNYLDSLGFDTTDLRERAEVVG